MGAPPKQQKPGTGIDRTTIHRLLALSPAQRVALLVAEARALSELDQKLRIR
ncbi:MAG TPA: hypothetical protein VGF28_06610 [Thermoanaerobaculia bacterium]|jgi:hypothetical protein